MARLDVNTGVSRIVCLVFLAAACATSRDAVGAGDSRLDERSTDSAEPLRAERPCGPDAPGNAVLLDATTGGPLTCLDVAVTSEAMTCALGSDCTADRVFRGLTNARGQFSIRGQYSGVRLVAVADGYSAAYVMNATVNNHTLVELEVPPAEGFWLKVLDADGTYLTNVTLTFRQGDEVLAKLTTNVLANVFFSQRQPFSGEPVTVDVAGFAPATIASAHDLGDDGHTLTLTK